jgi:hypothetical protein
MNETQSESWALLDSFIMNSGYDRAHVYAVAEIVAGTEVTE